MLVQQVATRAARSGNRRVEAPPSERVSRSASEPDSASLNSMRVGQPSRMGEARRRWGAQRAMEPTGLAGVIGDSARGQIGQEPGRSGAARAMASTHGGKT